MKPLISSDHPFAPLDERQRQQLFTEVLRAVSRSFYLTLRVLPGAIREPIGLAYLLARAADTLADTPLVPVQQRLLSLRRLESQLDADQPGDGIADLPKQLGQDQSNADEKRLLLLLPQLFALLHAQRPADGRRIRTVVKTLISGMVLDLETFPPEESAELKALDTPQALEQYTYLVAGCVGEFWTEMSVAHIPALKHWDEARFTPLGIRLGKALQYTNILRDLPRDLRMGRCYLPLESLARHQLTPEMLLNPANSSQATACLNEHLALAKDHYLAGLDYVTAIPRRAVRLRLAALWPMLIGLATLQRLKENRRWLDPDQTIKVDRRWVYKMILISMGVVVSNRLIRRWVRRLA